MADPKWITYDSGSGGPEYLASELRLIDAALFDGPAAGQVYSGVRAGTGLVTLAGTTITHQAMNFVIQGTLTTTGCYYGYEPTATKTLTAAHPSLNRVDAVWVRVQDHEVDASSQRRSIVEYTAGVAGSSTPGAGGVAGAPALPDAAVLLATIFVPLNNTAGAVVTDRRSYYTAPSPAPVVQVFTASGTWTKPANAKSVKIEVQAGGGAGGGAPATGAGQYSGGAGGGAGGNSEALLAASALGATVTVTVGAGGAGVSGAAGNPGGTSSFATHASATGGGGGGVIAAGSGNAGFVGGDGGVGSLGQLNCGGGGGGFAKREVLDAGVLTITSGHGGNSRFGGGGRARESQGVGLAGEQYGGGGGGAIQTANAAAIAGGAGGAGFVRITTYF